MHILVSPSSEPLYSHHTVNFLFVQRKLSQAYKKMSYPLGIELLTVIPLTREALAKLKLKALRRGVWFRDLKQSERKLLDLTISVVERVRSFTLANIISQLVRKLCDVMESRIYRLMRTEGRSLAEKLSWIARVWGNKSARSWANDQCFIKYLTVNQLLSSGCA